MPIPQVTDRLKEAPAVVLRAVFAGIGQVLLAADKIRSRALEQLSPGEAGQAGPAAQPGQGPAPARDQAQATGDVTVLREPATPAPTPTPAPAPGPAPERTAADGAGKGAPTGKPSPAGEAGAAAAPPIAGYEDLSMPSLRARLRVLDADTLRSLIEYERTHAQRDVVITMFERRLAKISGEDA